METGITEWHGWNLDHNEASLILQRSTQVETVQRYSLHQLTSTSEYHPSKILTIDREMDQSEEINSILEQMDWGDIASTLAAAIRTLIGEEENPPSVSPPPPPAPSPPPPPPPPPAPEPTGLEFIPHQPEAPQDGAHGGCFPVAVMPRHQFDYSELLQQSRRQCDLYSQGPQANDQGQINNVPVFNFPEHVSQNLEPVGFMNREMIYQLPAGFSSLPMAAAPSMAGTLPMATVPSMAAGTPPMAVAPSMPGAPQMAAAPLVKTNGSKSKKRQREGKDDGPHVKKPPNAFMLFMKEQRPNIDRSIRERGSASVNTALGQMWKSLTDEQQATYYQQALREKMLHAQMYPDWSSSDNYGKKRKRVRSKAPGDEAAVSRPEEDPRPKRRCVTPTQPAEPARVQRVCEVLPPDHTVLLNLQDLQGVQVLLPHSRTAVTLPVCNMCHLPQVANIQHAPHVPHVPHVPEGPRQC